MFKYLIRILIFVVISSFVILLSTSINSDFASRFLQENIITILLAFLAINITTISILISKMKDILEKHRVDFSSPIKEMKKSIIEQVVSVALSFITQIFRNSEIILNHSSAFAIIFDITLLTILFYGLYVLYDLANGLLIILKYEPLLPINSPRPQKKHKNNIRSRRLLKEK